MADERFPLSDCLRPGREHPAAGAPALTIGERRPGSLVEIACWADAPEGLAAAAGVTELPRVGRVASAPARSLAALAPARYLALAQDTGLAAALAAAVAAEQGAVVDVTHARAGLRIAGGPAQALLQKGLSFDLDPAAFPPMSVAQSGLYHMGVTVLRLDAGTFDVFVPSSFAGSLRDWVGAAAAEYGWRVGDPIA